MAIIVIGVLAAYYAITTTYLFSSQSSTTQTRTVATSRGKVQTSGNDEDSEDDVNRTSKVTEEVLEGPEQQKDDATTKSIRSKFTKMKTKMNMPRR